MASTLGSRSDARKGHRRSVVTDLFGRLVGLRTASAAHKRELQIPTDTVALLEACKQRGALVRARVLLRRFANVLAEPAPERTADLQLEAQAADQLEDTHEHEYLVHPTPETEARWLRSRHIEAEAQERLTRALEAHAR